MMFERPAMDHTLPTSPRALWAAHMTEARALDTKDLTRYAQRTDPGHKDLCCLCFGCACRLVQRERRLSDPRD